MTMLRTFGIAISQFVMLNLFQHPSCPKNGARGCKMDPETSSG